MENLPDGDIRERLVKALRSTSYRSLRRCVSSRTDLFKTYFEAPEFTFGSFVGHITWMLMDTGSGKPRPIPAELLEVWASLKVRERGQPLQESSLVLAVDAFLLVFAPDAYGHLLEDAVALRTRNGLQKGDVAEKSARKWAETTCRRVWARCFGETPAEPRSGSWKQRAPRRKGLAWRA